MKRLLLSLFVVALFATPAAAKFDPFEGPKPIAVFTEVDPWLSVIGSDTPRVAIYENGDVIFVKKIGQDYRYRRATLELNQLQALRDSWNPLTALTKLERGYSISDWTDQPTATFFFQDGEHVVTTSVYGLSCDDRGRENDKIDAKDAPPPELLAVHKRLCAIDFPDGVEWIPKYVEVMFWDYSYAPEKSIAWPKNWPSLESDRAVKRGNAYSIFLDGSLLPDLRKFLATQREKGAVELAGKKWAVSYRFTFPSEPAWWKAFSAKTDTK